MRRLTTEETNRFLDPCHLKIGVWNQLSDTSGRPFLASEWINYPAPEGALALYSLSHQVLRWLAHGGWAIVQVDNSTCFNEDEEFLISRLLFGPPADGLLVASRSFLFGFDDSSTKRDQWLLGDLLYMVLLFRGHCQVASAGSRQGQHLSIQDGYIYFLSKNPEDLVNARELMRQIQITPLSSPPDA